MQTHLLKGSGTVVMDRDWYIDECLRQLNNTKFYKLLDSDIITDIQNCILKYTERMNREKIINKETKRYLIQTHDRTENSCTVSTSRCPIQSLRKLF